MDSLSGRLLVDGKGSLLRKETSPRVFRDTPRVCTTTAVVPCIYPFALSAHATLALSARPLFLWPSFSRASLFSFPQRHSQRRLYRCLLAVDRTCPSARDGTSGEPPHREHLNSFACRTDKYCWCSLCFYDFLVEKGARESGLSKMTTFFLFVKRGRVVVQPVYVALPVSLVSSAPEEREREKLKEYDACTSFLFPPLHRPTPYPSIPRTKV